MTLSARRCDDGRDDLRLLQDVLARAPGYFILERGEPPGPDEAREILVEHPPGRTRADKEVLLAFDEHLAVGCVDLAYGWPLPTVVTIGLLLVAEDHQGRGVGRGIYAIVEETMRTRFQRIRLGVLSQNLRALAFWRARGFSATGETKAHQRGSVSDEILVFEKLLV